MSENYEPERKLYFTITAIDHKMTWHAISDEYRVRVSFLMKIKLLITTVSKNNLFYIEGIIVTEKKLVKNLSILQGKHLQ